MAPELSELFGRFRLHKKIGAFFGTNTRGKTEISAGTLLLHSLITRRDLKVVGTLLGSPAQIGFGVFMGTAHKGVIRQRR